MTPGGLEDALLGAVKAVTQRWASTRKAEEKDSSRIGRRRERLVRERRESLKEVAWEVMEAAYLKASAGGTLPASPRQIMYAGRGEIQERTGRTLDGQYFAQTLLPDYVDEHPEPQDWKIAYDARGHLKEPHTEKVVPLGTLDVNQYLYEIAEHSITDPTLEFGPTLYPTCGPRHRFGGILFVEKEGFTPLFESVQFQERFDLALATTKGMSVVACRRLVDDLCGGTEKIPLLVFRDFDKSGFSIVTTLREDTRRYMFSNQVHVIDCGLRLSDVQALGLQSESVTYASDPRPNLRANGATSDEVAFLCSRQVGHQWVGQRVELNAFTSDALVRWMEAKFAEHRITKVVPDDATLQAAYRRGRILASLAAQLKKALKTADQIPMPADLPDAVRRQLAAKPALPWDEVVARRARRGLKNGRTLS
jgi:hypothetical protein